MSNPMIEFKHVKKVYPGGIVALQDMNLRVDKGGIYLCAWTFRRGQEHLFEADSS